LSPTKHQRRKAPPASLTTMVLVVTMVGQAIFWSGNIHDQLALRPGQQGQGTTVWLGGTVIFLAITAAQNMSICFDVLESQSGTVRQKIESAATGMLMVLSLLAGMATTYLYARSSLAWDRLDWVGIALIFTASFEFAGWPRPKHYHFRPVKEAGISIFGILNRGVPRLTLGVGMLLTGYSSLGWGTVMGGQVVAASRTFNVYVNSLYDPFGSPWPFRTEAWGNLATQSFLTLAWLAVAMRISR
jgi:hypothetical protein